MDAVTKAGKRRFAKVYDKGWDTISSMAGNSIALRAYAFIAKHCDHNNALVCPLEVMAAELNCSERTVRRATKYLEANDYLLVVKVGTANAYILDHTDLWKNYDHYKHMVGFTARTLASKGQNRGLKARLTHYMGQPDLFDRETGEVVAAVAIESEDWDADPADVARLVDDWTAARRA